MRFFVILLASLYGTVALAHNPGLSTLRVEASPTGIELTLQFAPPDQDGDGRASAKEVADGATLLRGLVDPWLTYSDDTGEHAVKGGEIELHNADELIQWRAHIDARPSGNATIRLLKLGELVSGHREFVTVSQEGKTLSEALLSAREPKVEFVWAGSAPSVQPTAVAQTETQSTAAYPWTEFIKLGVEHILTGYDHLLYLAGLILACRRFRSILPIITSFTVAHSLTLGLATIGAVTLPSRFVEPMIAASIVYVGVENLIMRDREPKFRWIGAFLFGLIHGFGFAGLLQEMGVGSHGQSVLVPLFSFNAGVELGQLSLVALALPVLTWARRRPHFLSWGLPASSAAVALMGLYWLVERVWF